MTLGLHTYSLNLHGIGQAWAGFKLIGTAVGEGDIDMRGARCRGGCGQTQHPLLPGGVGDRIAGQRVNS